MAAMYRSASATIRPEVAKRALTSPNSRANSSDAVTQVVTTSSSSVLRRLL
jgi:hypothetical protein